jgi:hypothetical protein
VKQVRRPTLAQFARYVPRVQALGLGDDELAAVPVHAEPSPDDEFVSLGELPPGAPLVEPDPFPFIGTRQLYAYHRDVPENIWWRLAEGLAPKRPSGTGGTGMFGNADEQVVDQDNPKASWHTLDAGQDRVGS